MDVHLSDILINFDALLTQTSSIDNTESIWGYVLLLAVLIFLNAFFAASEIAIVSLNDAKLEKMANEGNK